MVRGFPYFATTEFVLVGAIPQCVPLKLMHGPCGLGLTHQQKHRWSVIPRVAKDSSLPLSQHVARNHGHVSLVSFQKSHEKHARTYNFSGCSSPHSTLASSSGTRSCPGNRERRADSGGHL